MKIFDVKTYDQSSIVLTTFKDLEAIYDLINKDENFVVKWTDDEGVFNSELVISNNLLSRVKSGKMSLMSKEDKHVKD